MRSTLLLLVSFFLAACGSQSNRTGFGPDAGGGANGDPSAAGEFAPNEAGASATNDAPCPNVDILFVIDNSGSMADKQQRLATSFPGFAAAIQKRLPSANSIHVGVVSTSSYYAGKPQECLIAKTEGPDSSNALCLSSAPYLTAKEPDFAPKFTCVARVGDGGDDDEKPMKSLLGALDPKNNGTGACNAGFSRHDALLIIVLITDEDDVRDADCDPTSFSGTCGSGGEPDVWAKTVIAAKDGHPENVVVLSLVSRTSGVCSNVVTTNVTSFTHKFGKNGAVGDVCNASYDAFFDSALPVVDQACVSFVPPPK